MIVSMSHGERLTTRLSALLVLAVVALGLLAFSAAATAAPGDLNGKIALSRFADIFVMNAGGTNKTRLTVTKELEESASFSPDGTKIAFLRRASLKSPRLYVMNADGSDPRALTASPETIESPTWSTQSSTATTRPRSPR